MKILQLDIEGYRSLKAQSWCPGDFNVVIGPNGSGKSNLLSLLEMLSHAANGRLGEHVQREGGMEPILWDGRAEKIRTKLKTSPILPYHDESKDSYTYDLTLARLGNSSAYRIGYEVLGNFCEMEQGLTDQPFMLLERDSRRAVIYSIEKREFEAPPDSVPEEEPLLSAAAGPFAANRFASVFRDEVAEWGTYQNFHTHPDSAVRRSAVSRKDTRVQADGQNLINVLHTRYESSRQFKRELNGALQSAFGDDFEELVFPPADDQRVQLRARWKSLQREQSAADLSDGTLRFLFLLTILNDPDPPSLIAIDEPETGLHPSMLSIVAEYARDAATRTQVILTTHSPEFLDACGKEAPTTTVLNWSEGETHLRVLSGESLEYWLDKYTLGELYSSSELEAME